MFYRRRGLMLEEIRYVHFDERQHQSKITNKRANYYGIYSPH